MSSFLARAAQGILTKAVEAALTTQRLRLRPAGLEPQQRQELRLPLEVARQVVVRLAVVVRMAMAMVARTAEAVAEDPQDRLMTTMEAARRRMDQAAGHHDFQAAVLRTKTHRLPVVVVAMARLTTTRTRMRAGALLPWVRLTPVHRGKSSSRCS